MNKLLTNFPVALTEEQKNVLKLTLSAVLQDDHTTKYWRPTVYENGDIMWALIDSEAVPMSQNIKGPSGFTPRFQIDQSTAEWQVTYDGTNWTSLGIIASGAQGPQGNPGQNGTDGTSIYLKSVTDAQGGKQVTLGWGTSDTSAFVIPSGTAGTPGTDGVSPTVTTSEIEPTPEHPQGGTSVTITDKTGPNQFNVWNGIDTGRMRQAFSIDSSSLQVNLKDADVSSLNISDAIDYNALSAQVPSMSQQDLLALFQDLNLKVDTQKMFELFQTLLQGYQNSDSFGNYSQAYLAYLNTDAARNILLNDIKEIIRASSSAVLTPEEVQAANQIFTDAYEKYLEEHPIQDGETISDSMRRRLSIPDGLQGHSGSAFRVSYDLTGGARKYLSVLQPVFRGSSCAV